MTGDELVFYMKDFEDLIDIVNKHPVSMEQLVFLCKESIPIIDSCLIDAAIEALAREKAMRGLNDKEVK